MLVSFTIYAIFGFQVEKCAQLNSVQSLGFRIPLQILSIFRFRHLLLIPHSALNFQAIPDSAKKKGPIPPFRQLENPPLKRRVEGGTRAETAHMMENEEGELVEETEEILKVYQSYYEKLLTTDPGITPVEKEAEEITRIVMEAIHILSSEEKPENIEIETIEKIVAGLKNKKAKDMSCWKNEYIKAGGN